MCGGPKVFYLARFSRLVMGSERRMGGEQLWDREVSFRTASVKQFSIISARLLEVHSSTDSTDLDYNERRSQSPLLQSLTSIKPSASPSSA